VNYYVYGGGGSAYYSPDLDNSGLTLDNIWNSVSMDTSWWRDTWPDGLGKCSMMFNSFICNLYGIKRIAYEGGPGFDPEMPGHNDSVLETAWTDARMQNIIVDHHNSWCNWGGDVLAYYVLNQNSFGWDFVETTYDLTHPKYLGILELEAAPVAPLTVGNPMGTTIYGNAFQLGYGDWRDSPESGTSWRQKEQWVSYQYNVENSGTYSATVNLTTPSGSSCNVDFWMDGTSVLNTSVPADLTQNVGPVTFDLTTGLHSLRVNCDVEGWVINSVTTNIIVVDVEDNETLPKDFSLSQNYPNPFNPETMINYRLPMTSSVTLKIYDILGKEIVTLVNEQKSAGSYSIKWNGKNSTSQYVGSGIYLYQLKTDKGIVSSKKMLMLK
jgi:hypothetical protein